MGEKKNFFKNAQKNLELLSKGAFLTTEDSGTVNTMTISWGSIGHIWNKPIITVLVRASRFTHSIIERSREFTVSVPYEDMQKALAICGKESGREVNKFKTADLRIMPPEVTGTPGVCCKGAHYECVVIASSQMQAADTDALIRKDFYPQDDYHTIYFGEIVNMKTDGDPKC